MVAMNYHLGSLVLLLVYILFCFMLPSHIYCLNHKYPPADSTKTLLLVDNKTRLGSTPPSCHNKCNQCHPCMAVQVPTMPGRGRVQRHAGRAKTLEYFDSSPSSNRYSNYKPLGWKCRCDGHLYNP
ncbi:hypothetical protein Leryth_000462 [Lithospermum erythrorhizon]|nr:hypothetical protein Leryth_000462 [Lithospermum erythrorhizon]